MFNWSEYKNKDMMIQELMDNLPEGTPFLEQPEPPKCDDAHYQMAIRLHDEGSGYFVGRKVKGTVLANFAKPFKTRALQLTLYGCEKVEISYIKEAKQTNYRCKQIIIDAPFELEKIPTELVEEGQYAWPFEITLPAWLPPSTVISANLKSTFLHVRYEVRAQFVPVEQDDWARYQNENEAVSKLRCSRMLFVNFDKTQDFPEFNDRRELNVSVGGIKGFMSTQCKTNVYLKQNQYLSGDTIQVRIECDNSKCDKDVKSFKFKLIRKYRGRGKKFKFDEVQSFVSQVKLSGLAAKSKCDRVLEFQLPKESLDGIYKEMAPELAKQLPHKNYPDKVGASLIGKLFSIEFEL